MIKQSFKGLILSLSGAALLAGLLALATPAAAGPPDRIPPRAVPSPIFDPNCKRPCRLWVRLPNGQRCRFVGCFVETGECAYRC